MNIGTELPVIISVILINAIFVLSEMSVASSRKARLQQRINEGDRHVISILLSARPSAQLINLKKSLIKKIEERRTGFSPQMKVFERISLNAAILVLTSPDKDKILSGRKP